MKKDGGTIMQWQLHTTSVPVERAHKKGIDVKTDKCYILSGTVVHDPNGRWVPGDHMKSSLVVDIDFEKGYAETRNSTYRLDGPQGDPILGGDLGDTIFAVFY